MSELDPVEIEINLKQNVSEESSKASQSVTDMSKATQASIDAMQKDIDSLNGTVSKMISIIEMQQKQMEANNETFGVHLRRLDEMHTMLIQSQSDLLAYKDTCIKVNEAVKEGADVMDVMRDSSKDLTETHSALSDIAEELVVNQKDIDQSMTSVENTSKASSTTNKVLSASIREVCSQLGLENAAIVNTVSNTSLLATVKNSVTNAAKLMNAQFGISIGLSKALMYGGIGLLIAGVAALAVGVKYLYDRYQEANKEMREQKALNAEIRQAYGEQSAKIKVLVNDINNENISLANRKKSLEDLKKIIPDYHASLDREGQLINNNKQAIDAYLVSLKEEIRLKSQRDRLEKLYAKQTEIDEELDDVNQYINTNKSNPRSKPIMINTPRGAMPMATTENLEMEEYIDRQKELVKEKSEIDNQLDKLEKRYNKNLTKNLADQDKTISDTLENRKKEIAALKEQLEHLEIGSDAYNLTDKTIKAKEKELAVITGKDKTSEKNAKVAQKREKQEDKASSDLAKKTIEYQTRIDAARVAAMEEGAMKERTAIQAKFDKEKALIAQEYKELEAIEKITGKPATEQRGQLKEYESASTAEYEANIKKLNDATALSIKEIFDNVNQKFTSELDNNLLAINKFYDDQVKAAKAAGASIDEINALNASRDKETNQARIDSQIKTLDFDTQIALRRMAISGKFYLFEATKIKETLEKQKQAATDNLALLKKKYSESPTDELAQQISAATTEIEEMDEAIKKTSTQKFLEIAGYTQQIASGLSGLFGDDSSFGKAMGWVADFSEAGAKIASGNPAAMIDGAFQALGTVKDIFATASQARKEIKEFAYELEQSAINYSIAIINALKDVKSINDSLFYTDTSNALSQGMSGYAAAIKKENELVSQLGDTTVAVGKKKKKFLGITTGTKTVWENLLTGYKKVLGENAELFDQAGRLDRFAAEQLLNSGKLSKEAHNLLTQALQAQEAADSAMAAVEATLERLSGSIGDDLKTALVDAFLDGDALSAAKSFKKSVSKTLEGIITDKLFSTVFGPMMSELEKRLKDSYSEGGDEDLVDDIVWFYKESATAYDKFYEKLDKAKQKLKEQGFDAFEGERTGTSKGIATASQDSINEWNGSFYAIRQQMGDLRNMAKEANVMRTSMLKALLRIVENTEFCRYLEDVKNQLEDIQTRGIKVKV